MNKVKYVRLEKEDGTYSESIPLSVDADQINMSNGKDLQEIIGNIDVDTDGNIANQLNDLDNEKINISDIVDDLNTEQNNKPLSAKQGYELNVRLNKKPYYYNTVADMKADINLKEGDMVITLGYYEPNDGGGAEYRIINNSNITDDIVTILLENLLLAELIIDTVNIKQFGAKGDDIKDDTLSIQMAINYASNKEKYDIFVPEGIYSISAPLFLFEFCNLYGEDSNSCVIHKATNTKANKTGLERDAIIILTDKTYSANSDLATDTRKYERVHHLKLKGNISNYIANKTNTDRQYAIWSVGYVPKAQIDNLIIENVDCGIVVKGLYTGWIKDIPYLKAFYDGIQITSESQGTILANINVLSTREYGFYIAGATYGSMQACLSEWNYGNTAFYLNNWHGDLTGCGFELGDGINIGFYLQDSKIRLTGGYFNNKTPQNSSNNSMVKLAGSSMTIANSVIGIYDQTVQHFNGNFATLYNSHLFFEDTNKIFCTFESDISTTGGVSYITIADKTIDVDRESISLPMSTFTKNIEHDFLDYTLNPTKKHPRRNIYMDNINYPWINTLKGTNAYAPAYNKGDVGFINNPLISGHCMWICNRDNYSDLNESVGTITTIPDSTHITLTDMTLMDYANTGIRLYFYAQIVGVNSGATATISGINYTNKSLTLTNIIGTFQIGEKIKLKAEDFSRHGDYLYVPIIQGGTTEERPTINLLIGQMYFDTTLGKPIFYTGSKWVDAIGNNI